MIKNFALVGLILSPCLSLANVDSFLGKAVLVQEIGNSGEIKNQYLDSFAQDPDGNKFTSVSPDFSVFGAFGICLKQDASPCSKDVNSKVEFTRAFSISSGRKQLDPALVPPVQDFLISATTTVLGEDSNSLSIQIDQKLFGGLGSQTTKLRISKIAKLSEAAHAFSIPSEDKPNRKSIKDVDAKLQSLAAGVVQLSSRPDEDNLLGQSSGSGTGFFVSTDGLLMTNHHVINDFKTCMEKLVCDIDFSQVMPDGSRRKFQAKATLLVASEAYDFALLKINLPNDKRFSFFSLEKKQIGADLITLGYPGDMKADNETLLTYSIGKLVGFHSRAYATSVYIYQGASGSPMLNTETNNVVAILSNGAGNPVAGIGSPGLARPILLIDAEFGLSDYISGSKMLRVKGAIASIESATTSGQAAAALDAYRKEKTYMGLNSLKRLMIAHKVPEVRVTIMKALEMMKVIAGSSDIEDALLEANPQVSPEVFLPLH